VLGAQRLAETSFVVGDEMRGGRQDVAGGAVVALQADHPRARKVVLEAQDVVDLGAAPAVDRLVVVADAADIRRWRPGAARRWRPGGARRRDQICFGGGRFGSLTGSSGRPGGSFPGPGGGGGGGSFTGAGFGCSGSLTGRFMGLSCARGSLSQQA